MLFSHGASLSVTGAGNRSDQVCEGVSSVPSDHVFSRYMWLTLTSQLLINLSSTPDPRGKWLQNQPSKPTSKRIFYKEGAGGWKRRTSGDGGWVPHKCCRNLLSTREEWFFCAVSLCCISKVIGTTKVTILKWLLVSVWCIRPDEIAQPLFYKKKKFKYLLKWISFSLRLSRSSLLHMSKQDCNIQ